MNLPIANCMMQHCMIKPVSTPFWEKILENALTGGVTGAFALIGILFAAWLAYRYALKQKKKETFIGLERIKYERKLLALETCWKLLQYTTDTENSKVILTWVKMPDRSMKYHINVATAKEFISGLADFFYGTGLGIYLSQEVKAGLFEYRSIVYGVLLKEKDTRTGSVEIANAQMAEQMIKLHQSLISLLKNETDTIDQVEMKK